MESITYSEKGINIQANGRLDFMVKATLALAPKYPKASLKKLCRLAEDAYFNLHKDRRPQEIIKRNPFQ